MIVAITNHKGGTGKTTTTINLAVGLTLQGKRVLAIDLDPQASLSYSLGILDSKADVFAWMLGEISGENVVVSCEPVDVVPSSVSYYERESWFTMQSVRNDHRLLGNALKRMSHAYDYILIDCPPSFSSLTENALMAADAVIIPTLFEVLPILGIEQILKFIDRLNKEFNKSLQILGVLGVNVDERRQLTYEVLQYIRDHYDVHVFNNYIRANVKAAEAPSFAKSVIEYAPTANSARDYQAFANEFLGLTLNIQLSSPKVPA
jgi:chromosome partitioning protein